MLGRILIVDDKPAIVKVAGRIAAQLGFDIRSITTSAHATENFIDFEPDVVILDMIMPEIDGIDVLEEMLLTGISAQFILTSGQGDGYLRLATDIAEFHQASQVSILHKPFRREQLDQLLRRAAAKIHDKPIKRNDAHGASRVTNDRMAT